MKKVLSVLCWIGIAVMISGCDNSDDDGGAAGGSGDYPQVSYTIDENDNVTCFNADNNVITSGQKCTWRCAFYLSTPQWVELTFDQGLNCSTDVTSTTTSSTGVPDTTTATENETCEEEMTLVNTKIKPCFWM